MRTFLKKFYLDIQEVNQKQDQGGDTDEAKTKAHAALAWLLSALFFTVILKLCWRLQLMDRAIDKHVNPDFSPCVRRLNSHLKKFPGTSR